MKLSPFNISSLWYSFLIPLSSHNIILNIFPNIKETSDFMQSSPGHCLFSVCYEVAWSYFRTDCGTVELLWKPEFPLIFIFTLSCGFSVGLRSDQSLPAEHSNTMIRKLHMSCFGALSRSPTGKGSHLLETSWKNSEWWSVAQLHMFA